MAFRFRRRRKPRVTWLPTTGTAYGAQRIAANAPGEEFAYVEIEAFNLSDTGTPRTIETPLVLDAPSETSQLGVATLADIQKEGLNINEQYSYHLRRIVGKLYITVVSDSQGGSAAFEPCFVEAGLIVRRVDSETGDALAQAADTETLNRQNVADPWIWKRNFAFGGLAPAQGATVFQTATEALWPKTTFEVGGLKDGPAFDIKTARRIGPEERLFLDITGVSLPIAKAGNSVELGARLYILFTYRALATIYSGNAGNRRNASR